MANYTADQLAQGTDASACAFAGAPLAGGNTLSFLTSQILASGAQAGGLMLPTNANGAGFPLYVRAGDAGTASNAGGTLYLQPGSAVSGASDGTITMLDASGATIATFQNAASEATITGSGGTALRLQGPQKVTLIGSTTDIFVVNTTTATIPTASSFNWSSTSSASGSIDTSLFRDAADTIAQRRGTNAQTDRIYNTYTDASNYERLSIGWATNVCTIKTQAAGTGTLRGLNIGGANTDKVGFYGTTAIVQPATGGSSATIVNGSGTAGKQDDTYDGYTLAQVVKALRNLGILA